MKESQLLVLPKHSFCHCPRGGGRGHQTGLHQWSTM